MPRLIEVLVVPLRDGQSFCARVTREGVHRYTKAVENEETALFEAGLVLRDPTRGSSEKPRVEDAT